MPADRFVSVFDVLQSGFKDWQFSAFGLIFVAIGTVIFLFPRIARLIGIPYLNAPSLWQKSFRYFFLGFPILWTVVSFTSTYSAYHRHKTLAQENQCRVVEGPVENFVPMPYAGHANESFTVGSVRFAYSDYGVSDGFNNTSSHGGPINKESYVRICYDPRDHVILRLAIRDYSGPMKDYSRSTAFPMAPDGPRPKLRQPPATLNWYGNAFMALYILDFAGIFALFRPYLRTFFTLRTRTLADYPIPATLEPGKKIKLRNSLIYWEKERGTIWLRPRGFNVVQTQEMAAKLITDADCKAIVASKLLFSSGFPVVMVVFLWTAYVLFSTTIPANAGLSAGGFIAFFALVFVILGPFALRRASKRMDQLVEDALTELQDAAKRSAPQRHG